MRGFPARHDCISNRGLHVRRESLGRFVHRAREHVLSPRAKPCRYYDSQLVHRCVAGHARETTHGSARCAAHNRVAGETSRGFCTRPSTRWSRAASVSSAGSAPCSSRYSKMRMYGRLVSCARRAARCSGVAPLARSCWFTSAPRCSTRYCTQCSCQYVLPPQRCSVAPSKIRKSEGARGRVVGSNFQGGSGSVIEAREDAVHTQHISSVIRA